MVYPDVQREPKVSLGKPESVTLETRLDQCITVILCILVLVNIGLWFARLCFHTSSLFE